MESHSRALAFVLFFDEPTDRTGHFVEGLSQFAQLVAMLDWHAMREVARFDVLRGAIKIGDGPVMRRVSTIPVTSAATSINKRPLPP